jgi:hypothetical protein
MTDEHHFLSVLERIVEKLHSALQKLVEAIAANTQTKQGAQQAKTQIDATVVSLPVGIGEYYRSEQSERRVKNRRESIRFWLEVVGVIAALCLLLATIITGCIFYGQLKEAQKQTGIFKKQAEQAAIDSIETAKRNDRQLTISQGQLTAAQDSVTAVKNAMYQQLRPHVLLVTMDLKAPLQPFVQIPVGNVFQNSGATPAINVWTRALGEIKPAGVKPDWIFQGSGSAASIGAGNTYEIPGMRVGPMQFQDFQNVQSGKSILYMMVNITYEDGFHHPTHHSQFCMVYDPITRLMNGCKPDEHTIFN